MTVAPPAGAPLPAPARPTRGGRTRGATRSPAASCVAALTGAEDDNKTYTCIKRCETEPGYVSFEDVIGTEAFRGDGSAGRPPEAGIISDPLVRTTSRLNAREAAQPRHRRRSPGPLGTRRGSAMHGLVKKYVNPCFGFLAGAFCCLG